MRGRLALVGYGSPDDAPRSARQLRRERNPLARGGGGDAGAQDLRPRPRPAPAGGPPSSAATAATRTSPAATDDLATLGVRAPGRMTDLLVPIARKWR